MGGTPHKFIQRSQGLSSKGVLRTKESLGPLEDALGMGRDSLGGFLSKGILRIGVT